MTIREVVLCADDFAQDEAVNAAVLRLVESDRLSAVSCFTDAPSWNRAGSELRARGERVFLGLHFNLTRPFGCGERPLAEWIVRGLVGRIDARGVRAHLERQFDAFVAVIGRPPDFIDGHQHVHALPVIRSVVNDFVATLRQNCSVRVRAVSPAFGRTDAPFKRWVIQRLARARPSPLAAAAAPLNAGFGGDYSLRRWADYEHLFADWLAQAPDGGLIMCHPALGPVRAAETAGQREYRFLASGRCRGLLAAYGCKLARRPDRFGAAERLTLESTGT